MNAAFQTPVFIINKLMQGPSAMPWRMDSTLTNDREDFLTRNTCLWDKH